ncbi:RNA 2',3'-cyclic phosphodiesterase [candidate division WOR-3 bacterium]|nr:RNA 2',3'-cyclic phosphodiesterase [candidate division WOR-3 bacterium]
MRAFFGIGLPAQIRREVKGFTDNIRSSLPRMKWVEEENLHITLRFLSEVDEKRIPEISSAASKAAKAVKQFSTILGRLGAFPNSRKARVFWWGLARGAEDAGQIFNNLERNLVNSGFEPERKPYHPHITLARLRNPVPLPVDDFKPPEHLGFPASTFTLYQSILTPQGPIYKVIEEFRLG